MFEKFSSQTTDDAFVEAAINANARREYIDKLVKTRVMFTRVLTVMAMVFALNLAIVLFISPSPTRSGYSYPFSVLNLITLGFTSIAFMIAIVSNDLAIKLLKALEAGAKQVS